MLVDALKSMRQNISWKPGKDIVHLEKRKRMEHIPHSASLRDYEKLISEVVDDGNNILYLYEYRNVNFYAVRGFIQNKEWLIIFGPGGLMETAFPPEDMDDYLNKRGFIFIGPVKEVLTWI